VATEPDDRLGPALTAGTMLRAARERAGLHVAALATSIKIAPKKLEALEADRIGDLPDAAFARALAKTVCRALKIDADPVLARMPQPDSSRLADVGGSLNTPFRERDRATDRLLGAAGFDLAALWRHPLAWAALALVVAAGALMFWPVSAPAPVAAPDSGVAPPAAGAAPGPGTAGTTVTEPVFVPAPQAEVATAGAGGAAGAAPPGGAPAASAPVVATTGAAPATSPPPPTAPPPTSAVVAAAPPGALLVVRAREASWVEVVDADGRALVSRTVAAGETLGLDGRPPLRVRIGNASATEVLLRGQPVDVAAAARENIARLELR
jgi:cytoskeleton protein RodZ